MKRVASAVNSSVTVDVLAPSLNSPISLKRTAVVSERRNVVEIPDISRDDISGDSFQVVPVSSDFSADHLHIRYLSSGRFANVGSGNFNGYRIQWSLPVGISLNTATIARANTPITIDRITGVARNTIAINLNDLPFTSGKGFSLIFGFACVGTAADDVLEGANGADVIEGWAGNDQISGGAGRDVLTGGEGSDSFVIAEIGNKNLDRVTDFDLFSDSFLLDFTRFEPLAAGPLAVEQFASSSAGVAVTSQQRILFATTSGQLFYDPDGSGPLARQPFAQVDRTLALNASHFLVG